MVATTMNKHPWYDKIHANHICGTIWLLFSLISLGIIIAFFVPIWKFDPQPTHCKILEKTKRSIFIQDDPKVTFKEYRSEFKVLYKYYDDSLGKNVEINSTLFGPTTNHLYEPNYSGATESLYLRNEFFDKYLIGQEIECFYSRNSPNLIVIEFSNLKNIVLMIPILFFLFSIFLFIYPPILNYVNYKLNERKERKDFIELMEMIENDKDDGLVTSQDYYFDDQVGMYRKIGTGEIINHLSSSSLIGNNDNNLQEEDEDDEYELLEEQIEVIGRFFGLNIEEQGNYVEKEKILENIRIVRNETTIQQSNSMIQEEEQQVVQQQPPTNNNNNTTLLLLDDDEEDEE
ncbi:hypothetical protein ABK040_012145 [Willaertia magna]